MPRDGATGIDTTPPGTAGVPDTTIESAKYNANVADVAADLNAARPIVAGGTGATSAAGALTALGAVAKAGDTMSGSLIINGDLGVAAADASIYLQITADANVAQMFVQSGGFSRWLWRYADQSSNNMNLYRCNAAGAIIDTPLAISWATGNMTSSGNLTISKDAPNLTLNRTATTGPKLIGQNNGSDRWTIHFGFGNPASDFFIDRHNDAGAAVGTPLGISRATGALTFGGDLLLGSYGFATNGLASTANPGAGNTTVGWTYRHDVNGPQTYWNAPNFGRITIGQNLDGYLINWTRSGVQVGAISVSATNAGYVTSSDERLKEDLKSFDAGNIVDDTKVYDFAWKATGERAYGVIAQQANEVYPTAVSYDKDKDWWGVDYSKYVPVILQELKALRARVAQLEGRLDAKPA